MKKLFYFTLILFSFFTSCHDDDNQNPNVLPEATQVGANTGGALIDGKVWVAKKEFPDLNPGGNNTAYEKNSNGYTLHITLRKSDNEGLTLTLINNIDIVEGTYPLNDANYSNNKNTYSSIFSNQKSNITIIKFDKKNKFVSGTFYYEAVNINGDGTKVVVTEGRFDKEFF